MGEGLKLRRDDEEEGVTMGDEAREIVWMCAACGRQGNTRMAVGDESCYLHAVQVYADTIVRKGGRVWATAVKVKV